MTNLTIYGKILGINSNDGMINLLVLSENMEKINIKSDITLEKEFRIGYVYLFETLYAEGERELYQLLSFKDINSFPGSEIDRVLNIFSKGSKYKFMESQLIINEYIEKIKNKILYDITKKIVFDNTDRFYTFPAGIKFHHAYVGGLASHTIGMLEIADSIIKNFPYLNSDYLYSGVILHDIGKVIEFSEVQNPEYGVKGQLLGHLVIGSIMVNEIAKNFGYENSEEVMILEHMIISHHGQPQFGAAKRPMTAEALVLWYIDAIDSKIRVLGEELDKTEAGNYTENIGVLDRLKYYKPII